jgi:hypothetical protein
MRHLSFVFGLLGVVAVAGVAKAHEDEAAAAEAAKPAEPAARSLKLRGFVSTALSHNLTYGGQSVDVSGVRAFDYQYGTISLDVAQLSAQYMPSAAGEGGFRIDVNGGYSIPRRTQSSGSAGSADIDILQAFASYIFDVGTGLRLDAGKFVTHLGAEVIEGVDGYNLNYSRSMLFFNAIPFAHVGFRLNYSIDDMTSLMLMVANGADVAVDTNGFKSVGAQIVTKPSSAVQAYVNYFLSANQPNDNHDLRHYVDVVLNLVPTEGLTLNLNVDWTTEKDTDLAEETERTQYGGALIVQYVANDMFGVALRGEYWATGTDFDGDGENDTMMGVTFTPTFTLGGGFAIRPEIRYDMCSADIVWVARPNGGTADPETSQITAALNVVALY